MDSMEKFAANLLTETIYRKNRENITGIKPPSDPAKSRLFAQRLYAMRGTEPLLNLFASGNGYGPFLELVDGSVKYDFLTGIGTHLFGYNDRGIIAARISAAAKEPTQQGHLLLGEDELEFGEWLLSTVPARFQHCWITTSGSMANDFAVRIIRHKQTHGPSEGRRKIFSIGDCFHGRTVFTASLAGNLTPLDITNHEYEYDVLPFPKSDNDLAVIIKAVKDKTLAAAIVMELVQGEGGFREWNPRYLWGILEAARLNGTAVWFDEVQTFGRTGELLACERLGVTNFADIVTIGKAAQASAVLYTDEYNPRRYSPKWVMGGTIAGSTLSLKVGKTVIRKLVSEGYLGATGKIRRIENYVASKFARLQKELRGGAIKDFTAVGLMAAFTPLDGSFDTVRSLVVDLFDAGVVTFWCGHGPYRIRMLLPAIVENAHLDEVFEIIESVLKRRTETKQGE